MPIPKVLKNFNLFVDGRGFAGLCDEVTLPELAITTVDHRAGGMDGVAKLDMGWEAMELGFKLAEHSPVVFRQLGLVNQAAVQVTFRAAMVNDSEVEAYVIHARGMYQSVNLGSTSLGDKQPLEATLALRYFRLSIGGEDYVEVDVDNMVRKIMGVDQLEAQRNALGM